MECEVYPTLLHMTRTRNRTPGHLILSPMPYPLHAPVYLSTLRKSLCTSNYSNDWHVDLFSLDQKATIPCPLIRIKAVLLDLQSGLICSDHLWPYYQAESNVVLITFAINLDYFLFCLILLSVIIIVIMFSCWNCIISNNEVEKSYIFINAKCVYL